MVQQQLDLLEGHVDRPWFRDIIFVPVDPRAMPEDVVPDILGPEEQQVYRQRYLSIRTYQCESPRGFASLYNLRLPGQNTLMHTRQHLDTVFRRQATAFHFNAAVGAILGHRTIGQLRYWHSSANNFRILDRPHMITRWMDLQPFLDMAVDYNEWIDHVGMQLPNSALRVISVTNITFYIYHIVDHPLGHARVMLALQGNENQPPGWLGYPKRGEQQITCVFFGV